MTFSPTVSPGRLSIIQSLARARNAWLNVVKWAIAVSMPASTAGDTVAASNSAALSRNCSGVSVT